MKLTRAQDKGKGTKKDLAGHLSELTKDELVELLVHLSKEYKEVERAIAIRFVESGSQDAIKQYQTLIKASIRQYADRHGFVPYRNVYPSLAGAQKVMDAADEAFRQGDHLAGAEIVMCVLHEMSDLMQRCDDSGGDVGGMIQEGLQLLQTYAQQADELDPKSRSTLFQLTLKQATHSDWDGWNEWRLSMMESAALWMSSPKERELWSKVLDRFEASESSNAYGRNYFAEEAAQLRYFVIKKFDGAEQAKQFLENHLEIKVFREIAIEEAILQEQYDKALLLVEQGEQQDRAKGFPGLVAHWEEKRAVIYEITGQVDSFKTLAKKFTLEGDYEFYVKLKEVTDSAEWEANHELLLDEIEAAAGRGWQASSMYTTIIIEENRADRLLRYVKQNLQTLVYYYEHLVDRYREEVFLLFEQHIKEECAAATNRKQYRKVCEIILHLIRAGGRERASELIGQLRITYSKRAALLDELNKLNHR